MMTESRVENPVAEKTKEELEREKLEMELRAYAQRLVAEDKKISLEVDKLERDAKSRYQWVKSVGLTLLVSLITFGGGILYQSRSDVEKEAQEKFSQVLVTLGSTDPSQRASAADALIPYLKDKKEPTRASDAVTAVVDRLLSDGDLNNKEHYSRALVSAGDFVVPYVVDELVRANRVSSVQFGRAAGSYVGTRLENPGQHLDKTECDFLSPKSEDPQVARLQEEQYKWLGDLQELISRSVMPFEADYSARGTALPRFVPLPLLQTPDVWSAYTMQCKYTLQVRRDLPIQIPGGAGKKASNESEAFQNSRNALVLASQNVAATSFSLVSIFPHASKLENPLHLEHIAIVNGTLDNLNLSGAYLNEAYVWGTAMAFKCEKCNLSYAQFGYFRLSACGDLRGSTVDTLRIDYDPRYRIDLRDTDWQRIIKFDHDFPTRDTHLTEVASPDPACETSRSSP